MSQGPYPPGYEPDDPPGAGVGRGSARVPQPDRGGPQGRDGSSGYPAPQYAGPEAPQDPHGQFRRPQPPQYGGEAPGGYGGQQPPGGHGGQQYGGQQQPYGAGGYPQQPGQPGPGVYGGAPAGYPPQQQPGQYGYGGDAPQYQDPTQLGGDRGPEAGRYSSLRYDEPGDGAPPSRGRRGLIIGVAVGVIVVLALGAVGVFYFLSSGSSNSFAVNSCVRKAGDKAESVSCSTAGSFRVVSKVNTPTQCPDQGQPYVVLQQKGKSDQVLCLKPAK